MASSLSITSVLPGSGSGSGSGKGKSGRGVDKSGGRRSSRGSRREEMTVLVRGVEFTDSLIVWERVAGSLPAALAAQERQWLKAAPSGGSWTGRTANSAPAIQPTVNYHQTTYSRSEDGAWLIERSPTAFAVIHGYLSSGALPAAVSRRDLLIQEAQYYGLHGLSTALSLTKPRLVPLWGVKVSRKEEDPGKEEAEGLPGDDLPPSKVLSVTLVPEIGQVITGCSNGAVSAWERPAGAEPIGSPLSVAPVSPDMGRPSSLPSVSGRPRLVRSWGRHPSWVEALTVRSKIDRSGYELVTGCHDSVIRKWVLPVQGDGDIKIPAGTLSGTSRSVWALIPLSNGQLASGGPDGIVRIWDPDARPSSKALVKELIGHALHVTSLAELPPVKEKSRGFPSLSGLIRSAPIRTQVRLVSGSHDGSLRVWNGGDGSCTKVLSGHTGSILCLAVTPPMPMAGVGPVGGGLGAGPSSSSGSASVSSLGEALAALASGPERRIVSGSQDGTVRVWRPSQSAPLFAFRPNAGTIRGIVALPNGLVASVTSEKALHVWDPTDLGAVIHATTTKIFPQAMAASGNHLVVASKRVFIVYEFRTSQRTRDARPPATSTPASGSRRGSPGEDAEASANTLADVIADLPPL